LHEPDPKVDLLTCHPSNQILYTVHFLADLVFKAIGFTKHYAPCLGSKKSVPYWHLSFKAYTQLHSKIFIVPPYGAKPAKPLVFFHGVGIGPMMYLYAILNMLIESGPREVFVVELPYISLKMASDVPTPEETADAVASMLGNRPGIFVGHSFGSLPMAWCLKRHPQIVDHSIFIDPVCFALCEHYIAYRFVYRVRYERCG
jgi:pimeloyl-ACP methyl ester carboxylesterase